MNIKINKLKINIYYNQPIGPKAYKQLYEDIKTNGIQEPLIIDKDYTIVDGMLRYKIAKELGYEEIPCIIL